AAMTAPSAFAVCLLIGSLFRRCRFTRLAERFALDDRAAGTHDVKALNVPRPCASRPRALRDDIEVEGLHAPCSDSEAERGVGDTGRLSEPRAHGSSGIPYGDLVIHLLERERAPRDRYVDAGLCGLKRLLLGLRVACHRELERCGVHARYAEH